MQTGGVRKPILVGALGVAWFLSVAAMMKLQMDRERLPGQEGVAASRWPESSPLPAPSASPVLVVALHPKCPCSRATLEELAVLHRDLKGSLRSTLLILLPEGCPDDWARTDLWTQALSIPGVTPVLDRGGEEASRFGARTSGHAFLYAPEGRLLFSGGLTRARGETGPNAGRAAITALVGRRAGAARDRNPVFGCPLSGTEGGTKEW